MAVEPTDGQLLKRFVRTGEESAFAAVMQRHALVVRGVCRRLLHHEQDAEDVCQAAFVVLARKADKIDWQPSVRNWLCATAHRLALHARARATRLHLDEAALAHLLEENRLAQPQAMAEQRELRSVLDDELHRLPEKYRAPVVLCYLEGMTNEEAARQLGWATGSMSRRLARARLLLQDRLTRRGLALAVFLTLAVGWLLWGAAPGTVNVAARHGDSELTAVLERLHAAGDRPTMAEARRLLAWLERAGTTLHAQSPREQRDDWQAATTTLTQATADLATALQNQGDAEALRRAAGRLKDSCVQCHAAFRPGRPLAELPLPRVAAVRLPPAPAALLVRGSARRAALRQPAVVEQAASVAPALHQKATAAAALV